MKKLTVLLALMCLSIAAQAQETQIKGVVIDSLEQAMQLANVVAFSQQDSSIVSFGTSDSEGRYLLKVKTGESYFIRCSYIGYKTWEKVIFAKDSIMEQVISLELDAMNLDAFDVVYEFPVSMSGDTLSYKTDAFTNGKERKLGDVLDKLPGLEVEKNGDIKFQGKKVDKVLVEGKEFFDGDSKMAVQNIPANVIDKIDVINNYNEVGPMQGLNNDESIAINVQLKEGQKSIWFGDIEAGVGAEKRYLAHPNIFYYSPKTSVNFIGDANNIGQQAFSMQDYFRFNGGFESIARRGGSSFSLSSDELGLAMMQNDRSFYSATNLAALNLSHQANKKWRFSTYGIFSAVNNQLKTQSQRNYVGIDAENSELTASVLDQKLGSGLLKFEAAYTPNSSVHIGYEAFAKASDISNDDNRVSTILGQSDTLLEYRSRDPFSLEQKFEVYATLNDKNILTAEANWMYKKQQPRYFLQTKNKPFDGILPLLDNESYRLSQDRYINSNKIESVLNYYYLINPRNHINFSAGINALIQDYRSGIEQLGDSENTNILDPTIYANDASYNFYDNYLSAHYRTKLGKLTLSPGINFHYYTGLDVQNGEEMDLAKNLCLPDFYANYAITNSQSLTARYGINAEFTDIQNRAAGSILRNYNSLFRGNQMLENLWYHNLSLNYTNFNMFNFTNLYVMLNYQKRYDDINESVVYSGQSRLSVPTNALTANENIMGSASFQKKFTFMKVKADVDYRYSSYQNTVEFNENRNTSFSQTYKFSAESNFINWPNIEVGIESSISDYTSSQLSQQYISNNPFVNIEAIIPGGFMLTAEYIYTNYVGNGGSTSSSYAFLNTAAYYRKDNSPWEFKLSGNNLLDTEFIRRDSFSDNIISSYTYYIQPLTLMFSVKYEL